jgi:hypothetical protein
MAIAEAASIKAAPPIKLEEAHAPTHLFPARPVAAFFTRGGPAGLDPAAAHPAGAPAFRSGWGRGISAARLDRQERCAAWGITSACEVARQEFRRRGCSMLRSCLRPSPWYQRSALLFSWRPMVDLIKS